jgi:hypothetical protein
MEVHLKGHGSSSIGKYSHSNAGEGAGMSWGGKNSNVNWKLEWNGELSSGAEVFLFGKAQGKYFASNAGEGAGMSWGGKSSNYNWQLEWDGDLTSGTHVSLKGHGSMAVGKYFASNAGEGKGMSWGGKSSNYNWQLEWDSGCLFSAGTGTNALQQTLNQDLTGNAQAAAQSSTNAAEEIGGFDNPRYNPKTYAGCDRNRCETLSCTWCGSPWLAHR